MHSQHRLTVTLTMTWNLVLVLLFNYFIACDSNALPSVLSAILLLWGYFIFALKMLICQTHRQRLGEISELVLNRPMAM